MWSGFAGRVFYKKHKTRLALSFMFVDYTFNIGQVRCCVLKKSPCSNAHSTVSRSSPDKIGRGNLVLPELLGEMRESQ